MIRDILREAWDRDPVGLVLCVLCVPAVLLVIWFMTALAIVAFGR